MGQQVETLPAATPAWAAGADGNRLAPRLLSLLPAALLVTGWGTVSLLIRALRGVPFPTPLDTLVRAAQLLSGEPFLDHTVYVHLLASLARWGAGFVLAAGSGVVLGLLCGGLPRFGRLVTPMATLLQPIPSLAWIPVAILLFGLGPTSTIFIIFLAGVFPVILNTSTGVRSVDEGYLRAARMLGADEKTVFRRVLVPGAFPYILAGLRVALANGWRSLIAAEMLAGAGTGLGYAIFQARWNLDYASAFVNIILIAIAGLVCEGLVFARLERRTVERWGLIRREG